MCAIDDAEPVDVWRASYPRARKQYKCEECGRLIEIGELHGYVFTAYEGRGWTFRTCRHCRVGQGWLSINCGGWMPGALMEEMQEHVSEYPDIAFGLRRIIAGMKRKWTRFDRAGLMPAPPLPRAISEIMT